MRWLERGGAFAFGVGLGAALGLGVAAREAAAASTSATLGVELGPQRTGNYGSVEVTEVSVGLDRVGLEFRITLSSSLGKNADLHEFYFNLPDQIAGVRLTSSGCGGGSCNTPFQLDAEKATSGGAGSRFDYRVSFGNGRSSKGNGNLQLATFRIEANSSLGLNPSPFDASFTARHLAVLFAAHVPGARHVAATIGATTATPVPEPGTAALFGLGLVGLTWVGRRQR
jgi:hypothetical protein